MLLYLAQETRLFSSSLTLLHFAPEYALMRSFGSRPNLHYIPADLDPPAGGVRMDMTDCPLEDDSVDMILSSHVLEHVEDDRGAMREMLRVLKPGGSAVHMVPVDDSRAQTFEDPSAVSREERKRAFGQDDHVRIYGRDLVTRFREAGFAVRPLRYARELSPDACRYFGLRDEVVYVCTKPAPPESLEPGHHLLRAD